MNINGAFPSKYLKASDLGESAPVVIIDHVVIEGVGQDKEQRPIIYFQGKEKGLVCNKTNANQIVSIAGTSETDDWSGVKVQLFVAMVEFKGETVEAIRVRAPKMVKPTQKPMQKPKAAEPMADYDDSALPSNDDIQF